MRRCSRAVLTLLLLRLSGESITIEASPSRILSRASLRSGGERRLLTVTALVMPFSSRPAIWSAISATSGETTTVRAPVFVVPGQRRELVADGFAGAGGQDSQGVAVFHGHAGQTFLERDAVSSGGFGPEGIEPEPSLQFPLGIVVVPAPAAVFVAAISLPQSCRQLGGCRKVVYHPGRDGRAGSLGVQPSYDVGQGPGILLGFFHHGSGLGAAAAVGEKPVYGFLPLRPSRALPSPDFGEAGIVGLSVLYGGEPVPGGQEFGTGLLEVAELALQGLHGQAGVQQGVVAAASDQAAVLVVLDQPVVGVAWEGQGVEHKGVEHRLAQQAEVWRGRSQVVDVEGGDVVAGEVGCVFSHLVQGLPVAVCNWASDLELFPGVGPDGCQGEDLFGVGVDFQVQRQSVQQRIRE